MLEAHNVDQKDGYRPYVDGLRAIAIAIAIVVLYHAKIPGFAGGFVGVDVFFVISGFLITKHLLHEALVTGKISLLSFYSRRIRRLFPALFFLIIFVMVAWLQLFSGLSSESEVFFRSVKYSVFGLANFFFMKNTGGYFDHISDEMPLLHFWSLAVEEQFYLIWPMAIAWVSCCSSKQLDKARIVKHRVFVFLLIMATGSFLLNLWLVLSGSQAAAFYMMPARGWEFAIGGLLAFGESRICNSSKARSSIVSNVAGLFCSLIGVLLIAYSTFAFSSKTAFPGFYGLVPTTGTGLLILGCIFSDSFIRRLLSVRLMILLGLLSYGIYLWHWPLLVFLKIWGLGEEPSYFLKVIAICGSICFSYISVRFIEGPLKSFDLRKRFAAKRILKYGLGVSSFIALTALGFEKFEPSLSLKMEAFNALIKERNSLGYECVDKPEKIGTSSCIKFGKLQNKSNIKSEIIVWGDSHAFGIFPMVEEYISGKDIAASLYSNSSRPPFLPVPGYYWENDEGTRDLASLNYRILSDIRRKVTLEATTNFSAVLAVYWQYCDTADKISLSVASYCFDRARSYSGSLEVFGRSLKKTLDELSLAGVSRKLIILPYPKFRYTTERCLKTHSLGRCKTDRLAMEMHAKDYVRVVDEIVRSRSDVRAINPVKYLCSDVECNQAIDIEEGQIPVVFDDNHPSASSARFLGKKIHLDLDWITYSDSQAEPKSSVEVKK